MRHATPPKAAVGNRGFSLRREDRGCHPRLWIARRAFTLIELLVVIGIILLIAAITMSAVNLSISGDRIRGAARQTQSYLEGARSRAVYGGNMPAKGPNYQCGVRFIRESNDSSDPRFWLVSSMQYVELDPDAASFDDGSYDLRRVDNVDNTTLMAPPDGLADSDDVTIMHAVSGTNWLVRYNAGLIYDWQIVLINGRKYQIRTTRLASGIEELVLTTPYSGTVTAASPAIIAVSDTSTPPYQVLLRPQPMANQEPRSLGNGVVIDLRTPTSAATGNLQMSKGLDYFHSNSQEIDIMFSPRGTIVGRLSGTGLVEFVLSDREDALKNLPITDVTAKRERLIVSLKPQTGMTAVHPVFVDPSGTITDPYRYSETGEVARQ